MKRVEYQAAVRVMKEMNIDENLLAYLNRMSEKEKEHFVSAFAESVQDEIMSFFAINNRGLFNEYLTTKMKENTQKYALSLN